MTRLAIAVRARLSRHLIAKEGCAFTPAKATALMTMLLEVVIPCPSWVSTKQALLELKSRKMICDSPIVDGERAQWACICSSDEMVLSLRVDDLFVRS